MFRLTALSVLTAMMFGFAIPSAAWAGAPPSFMGLGDLPGGGFYSSANGMSPDGTVIVGESESANGTEAFLWTMDDGMVPLGDLPGGEFSSWANDASWDGSVIVGRGAGELGLVAAIWDQANGWRSIADILENDFGIDMTDWSLSTANAVSDDGRVIVGHGVNPSGFTEGWIATIPEPASGALLGLALTGIFARKRRTRL